MSPVPLPLEDLVTAVYCALDDALSEAGIKSREGKLIPRPGPPPEMDDREVLCLAVLQELLAFESDHAYFLWLEHHATLQALFPRLLSRQKFADRRVLLTPLIQKLTQAFRQLGAEGSPLFRSSTPIPSTSANSSGSKAANACKDWRPAVTAPR